MGVVEPGSRCYRCKAELADTDKFCRNCGRPAGDTLFRECWRNLIKPVLIGAVSFAFLVLLLESPKRGDPPYRTLQEKVGFAIICGALYSWIIVDRCRTAR